MKRMFLAFPIPQSIEEETARCRTGLPGLHWAEGLHLTVHFLGDVTVEREESLRACLSKLRIVPFELQLGSPGVFANPPGKTILWLRCIPEEPVREVKRRLDSLLTQEGFRLEKKYHPHVTLARGRSVPQHRLHSYLLQFEGFCTSSFRVEEVVLFSSVLQKEGARHTVEGSFGIED